VLEEIAPLFTALFNRASGGCEPKVRFRQSGLEAVTIAPQVQVFATMNPASIGGGRNALPRSVLDLFTPVDLVNYPSAEIRCGGVVNACFACDCLENWKALTGYRG
jgi:hypothetical protein